VLVWSIPAAVLGRLVSYLLPGELLLSVFVGLLLGLSVIVYVIVSAVAVLRIVG